MDQGITKWTGFAPSWQNLIGAEFEYGGRGPDKFDCYGLIIELHKRQGIVIPDFLSTKDQEVNAKKILLGQQDWELCHPAPGAVLTFKIGRHVSHVGMIIDDYRFVHSWEGAKLGVAVERIDNWRHRICGCYKYKNNVSGPSCSGN